MQPSPTASSPSAAPLAVVWLADGVEEIEAVTVLDVLRRAGIEALGMALGDALEVRASRGVRLLADCPWDAARVASADLLVAPGGMGGMQALRDDVRVTDALRDAVAEGRCVAALCAGPLVLARAGILQGRRATCYPGLEGDLSGAIPQTDPVVRDGPVITSRGPATAMAFAVELVRALCGAEVAATTARGLLLAD